MNKVERIIKSLSEEHELCSRNLDLKMANRVKEELDVISEMFELLNQYMVQEESRWRSENIDSGRKVKSPMSELLVKTKDILNG